jgi:hypothetical protein
MTQMVSSHASMPWVPCQQAARRRGRPWGVAGGVEEVRGAKMLIAGLAAGVDRGHVDGDLGSGPTGCPSATWIAPDTPVNRPRTLVSMKWRPMKATSVWPGSTCHWPGAGSSAPPAGRRAMARAGADSARPSSLPNPWRPSRRRTGGRPRGSLATAAEPDSTWARTSAWFAFTAGGGPPDRFGDHSGVRAGLAGSSGQLARTREPTSHTR